MACVRGLTVAPKDEGLWKDLRFLFIESIPICEHPTGHQDETDVLVPPHRGVPPFLEVGVRVPCPADEITGLEGGLAGSLPTRRR